MSGQCHDCTVDFYGSGGCLSAASVQIRDCMRLLWEEHIYWTRMVILGIVFDTPDLPQTTDRLLRNATDFGMAFSTFYGNEVGTEFGRLIREHLVIAAEIVKDVKAGDSGGAEDAERRWYVNADQIARFLSCINPYWSYEQMRQMWFVHLSLTKDEAVAALQKDYARSIDLFNQIEVEAMMMADIFTDGISCQFGL
ncbi:MAG TPA: acetylglutamate kinase [Bacillota bacterium]|nr:acetylglutamate kinase [Bacillota bacterium]